MKEIRTIVATCKSAPNEINATKIQSTKGRLRFILRRFRNMSRPYHKSFHMTSSAIGANVFIKIEGNFFFKRDLHSNY